MFRNHMKEPLTKEKTTRIATTSVRIVMLHITHLRFSLFVSCWLILFYNSMLFKSACCSSVKADTAFFSHQRGRNCNIVLLNSFSFPNRIMISTPVPLSSLKFCLSIKINSLCTSAFKKTFEKVVYSSHLIYTVVYARKLTKKSSKQ